MTTGIDAIHLRRRARRTATGARLVETGKPQISTKTLWKVSPCTATRCRDVGYGPEPALAWATGDGCGAELGDQNANFDKDPMEGRPVYGDPVPRRRGRRTLGCAAGDGCGAGLGDQNANLDKDPMEGRPLYGDPVPRRRIRAEAPPVLAHSAAVVRAAAPVHGRGALFEGPDTNSMNSGAGGGTAGARAEAPAAAVARKGRAACESSDTNSVNSGAGGGTAGARTETPATAVAPKDGVACEGSGTNSMNSGAGGGTAASDAILAVLPNRAALRSWKCLQRRTLRGLGGGGQP